MRMGPLEVGSKAALHIREETLSSREDGCRLLYVSDVHLRRGRSERIADQVVHAAEASEADAILLGGDLVDSASELHCLTNLVHQLSDLAPVMAVGGNHDAGVGLGLVRDAAKEGGARWIHESAEVLEIASRSISVQGPECDADSGGDVRVLCAHNPRIWKTARRKNYDLVLAGHLHGCQAVAFEFRDRLFPGVLFYPYNFLNHQFQSTRLVVSRGVSDLVPIRWGCPREVVLCVV